MKEKLIADWLLDCGPMERALLDAEYKYNCELDASQFRMTIQAWLDSYYENGVDPFDDNECVACDYWLEDEGFELIEKVAKEKAL